MSEIKETTDKTLRGDVRKPLSLKRTVESGHVRQSFSHGRSKSVVVEKKKKRTISAPGEDAHGEDHLDQRGGLSSGELDARRRALEIAKERADAEVREAVERAELESQRAREAEAAQPPPAPAEAAPPAVTQGADPQPAAAPEAPAEPAPPPPPSVAKPELPRGG